MAAMLGGAAAGAATLGTAGAVGGWHLGRKVDQITARENTRLVRNARPRKPKNLAMPAHMKKGVDSTGSGDSADEDFGDALHAVIVSRLRIAIGDSQNAAIKPALAVVEVSTGTRGESYVPGAKTFDQDTMRATSDPRARRLDKPKYMTKAEDVSGAIAARLQKGVITAPPRIGENDVAPPAHTRNTLKGWNKPVKNTKGGLWGQMFGKSEAEAFLGQLNPTPLVKKAPMPPAHAAKARWLKEGHHDLDPHFDQQAKTASGAELGRANKIAAIEAQRKNTWNAVADTQGAYDKVRKHLHKDANLMMEVPHQAGLLYNPEGVGNHHFDKTGKPKHPLYLLHPAEADDWIKQHGHGAKDVKKSVPSGLIETIADLNLDEALAA